MRIETADGVEIDGRMVLYRPCRQAGGGRTMLSLNVQGFAFRRPGGPFLVLTDGGHYKPGELYANAAKALAAVGLLVKP